jgi:hypothetical protein
MAIGSSPSPGTKRQGFTLTPYTDQHHVLCTLQLEEATGHSKCSKAGL